MTLDFTKSFVASWGLQAAGVCLQKGEYHHLVGLWIKMRCHKSEGVVSMSCVMIKKWIGDMKW